MFADRHVRIVAAAGRFWGITLSGNRTITARASVRFGGPFARLEIICGSNDFDADTAERYGWVNRSIPDAELDAFVDDFAHRIASFEKRPLTRSEHGITASD